MNSFFHLLSILFVVILSIRFGIFYERLRVKSVFIKRFGVKITDSVFCEPKE